ncbi:LPS-assembly protein LptD [Halosquirtibacter xylanolyticus]|uniref:putative LPS assembly protein LptD n=1 Tax=Halosquirtibacter xylanolyticus TaxID=3374599 RepID=UPI0037493127|nr:LPS-assembly protein LptD [Prolixibacteraceae bacterium]
MKKNRFILSLLTCLLLSSTAVQAKWSNRNIPSHLFLSDTLEAVQDTMTLAKDTIENKSNSIDAQIISTGKDSIVVMPSEGKTIYYGDASVTYKDLSLKAAYIEMTMDSSEIFAKGMPDSTGTIIGKPIFKQGPDEFDADQIRYNFNTKKGIVTGVVTEQQGGNVQGGKAKMLNDSIFCMVNGKYSTCDHEHPHFYLQLTKAKVVANKKIISGPAYMVVEDVPLKFLFLPFGYFPNQKTYSSGILIPSYGEEQNRGFFLRDLGYYWAASPYFDFQALTDIYSNGSWGIKGKSTYKKRYSFNGNFDVQYYNNKFGEQGITTGSKSYREEKQFSIRWNHSQDAKANPTQTFSASVNLSSTSFNQDNATDYNDYLSGTQNSSISYSKNWPSSPFSLSSSLSASQNTRDSTISLSLPNVSFNMSRVRPFKRENMVGGAKWYDNLSLSYSLDMKNSINTKQDQLMNSSLSKDWRNGVKHTIPVSTSIRFLKYITATPSISYNERWYMYSTEQQMLDNGTIEKDTINGFTRDFDYSFSIGTSTTLYGMYQPINKNSKIKGIRHVMRPSLSFSYRPDFSDPKYGLYGSYINNKGVETRYSYHSDGVYGYAGSGKSGSLNFSLDNNIEMKVLNSKDTTSNEPFKKIALLDQLSFSTSYNLMADSLNLSPIQVRGRTKVAGVNINFGTTLDPYYFDENAGTKVNTFLVKETGNLVRVTNANLSFGMNFNSKKKDGKGGDDKNNENQNNQNPANDPYMNLVHQYADFDIPWNFSFDYSFNYSNTDPRRDANITQTLNFRGDFNLTKKWKVSFTSGYDIQKREVTFTSFHIYRNLHCFQMSFDMVPFGYRQSYTFTIQASASMLKDLKITKRQSFYDNQSF